MSDEKVKQAWEEEWKLSSNVSDRASFIGVWIHKQKMKIINDMLCKVDNRAKTIDLGCGGGITLSTLRMRGFYDSIGIDYSDAALENCEKLGFKKDKDVFYMDAMKTTFPDKTFNFCVSEGLWEHYKDPTPFMDETCRLSNHWIMISQPDHFSFFGGLLHWAWLHLGGKGVLEYSFKLQYFIDYLKTKGFVLIARKSTLLHEQSVMLFELKSE
jgi:2-polyprenyl-3-methyl-5-hydroxy-6-metoxy-1,4-benzoquinol methylase